ncbi:MAG: hypothetical protein LBJ00_15525 [Planctomycetaceae bacterium]|jgi:ferredoxin-like protein FixX|nr:hypothetical protein [Planctomycetaceae bacterium]
MKKTFSKTIQQITGLLSLLIYVYALILLPALHIHHNVLDGKICESKICNDAAFDSCPAHSYSYSGIHADSSNQECAVCEFICTTIPLFAFDAGVVEVVDVLPELVLVSKLQESLFICGVPSCRAPPFAV